MEWGRTDQTTGKRRQHWFVCTDQQLFAFAGVWKDSEIPSFALLTCEANAGLHELGVERMPVILPSDPAAWQAWLHGEWKQTASLLAPFSSSLMRERSGL
jgi:putative SOS response-associated peptidase YedK